MFPPSLSIRRLKVYKMPSFNATVGDNNQKGWLELDLSAQRPQFKGRAVIGQIRPAAAFGTR